MSPPPRYLRERPKYAFTTSSFLFFVFCFFFFCYIKKVNKKEEKREKSEEKDRRLKRKGKEFCNWLIIYIYIFDLILSCFHAVWLSRLIRTEYISFC